jgi:hypothetical protein
VTSGALFARADYSSHADFGRDLGAVLVSSGLFGWVADRRAEYVERSARQGADRNVAQARSRGLSPEELGLEAVYPDAGLRAFVWERMERDPGAGIRNTFVYLTALRVLQDYSPHLLVVCFGEPGEDFSTPPARPQRSEARSEADYQNRLGAWRARLDAWRQDLPRRREEALVDLDLYVDYLYREFRRNPYYGPRGMFVLVLGDPASGAVQAVVVSPRTPAGVSTPRPYGLIHLGLTLAAFLDVSLPQAAGGAIAEALPAPAAPTTRPAASQPTSPAP